MPTATPHLYRSRHGIFYCRIVVPPRLRTHFPALPREVRTSTRTANRRLAARQAAGVYVAWFQVKTILESAVAFRTSSFLLIEDHPLLGRRELRTTPSDPVEHVRAVLEYLERTGTVIPPALRVVLQPPADSRAVTGSAAAEPAAVDVYPSPAVTVSNEQPSGASATASARGNQWLSEFVAAWKTDQEANGTWSAASTWSNSYGPALRVFREHIAFAQRVVDDGTAIWDIRLRDITPERVEQYIEDCGVTPRSRASARPRSMRRQY